ncbi:MAG: 16S rRNA (uracil(1498)-N(3))-methyltransferase [Bacteroidetes bacterium]|nr:MAG: 16S rRNA (uracil(1498)-N(3))-methyltransferase [Bacteroidota bacterium]
MIEVNTLLRKLSLNNLFYTSSVLGDTLKLEGQEAVHCSLVLRKRAGDIIYVIDGKGNRFKCGIDALSKRDVNCTILSTESQAQSERITIAIAPTKNRDRLEWMIEKVVEIGVASIVLMNTTNTERTRTNLDRLNKKAVSAVKQSLRFFVPEIMELDFLEVLNLNVENKYIAHCYNDQEKTGEHSDKEAKQLILIGPEGDFTAQEVEQAFALGFKGLDLGEFRLRTETAAIVAVTKFQ